MGAYVFFWGMCGRIPSAHMFARVEYSPLCECVHVVALAFDRIRTRNMLYDFSNSVRISCYMYAKF